MAQTTTFVSRDELYGALAEAAVVEHRTPQPSGVSRVAAAVRYIESSLIPVAGGVWLYNLATLIKP